MGFPIHLAIRQGNDHNYMLCIIALSCFFLACFFASCGWICLLIFLRNEKKQCAKLWVDCKKHDRKKQRSVDCAEADKKTVQTMRHEWWGFLAAGDFLLESRLHSA